MPNWCENQLTIIGGSTLLRKFNKQFKSGQDLNWETKERSGPKVYSFETFIPIPQEIIQQGFHKAGYDWCIANWSTKWDINGVSQEAPFIKGKDLGSLYYLFDTAWGPPLKVVEAMSLQYPDLTFKLVYGESGSIFYGEYVLKGGWATEETFEVDGDEAIPYLIDIGLWVEDE